MAFRLVASAKIVNVQAVEAALKEAFEEWLEQDVNDEYFDEQFLADRWQYPPPSTERKNGQIAGNPRDIYDTGKLWKSGRESFTISRGTTTIEGNWHWNAQNSSGEEYAWFVHEGQGPYSRAPRPWTDELAVPYLFETSEPKRDLELRLHRRLSV